MATLADSRLTGPVTEINAVLPDTESEVSVLGSLRCLRATSALSCARSRVPPCFNHRSLPVPVRYEANIVMMPLNQNSSWFTLGQLGTGGSIGSLMPLAHWRSGGLVLRIRPICMSRCSLPELWKTRWFSVLACWPNTMKSVFPTREGTREPYQCGAGTKTD